jgi:cyanophycinase
VTQLRVSEQVAGWERGAYDPETVAEAERADGIWLPGGDQNAITRLLLTPEGADTPLLAALRRRLDSGAAIGGTSAGAAVMSDPMIGSGTSFGSLALPRATGPADAEVTDALWVTRGFGFFTRGIVDQHFDSRARLARLVEAAMVEDGARRLAFGVAEDSAMVYDRAADTAEMVGAGGLYVVDTRNAARDAVGGRTRIRGVVLHYLTPGDRMDLGSCRVEAVGKTPIDEGSRTFAVRSPVSCGVLSPYGRLAEFAGSMLMDNDPESLELDAERGIRFVRSLAAGSLESGSPAWEIRLGREDGSSRAWYGSGIGFEGVVVDIVPARLEVSYP